MKKTQQHTVPGHGSATGNGETGKAVTGNRCHADLPRRSPSPHARANRIRIATKQTNMSPNTNSTPLNMDAESLRMKGQEHDGGNVVLLEPSCSGGDDHDDEHEEDEDHDEEDETYTVNVSCMCSVPSFPSASTNNKQRGSRKHESLLKALILVAAIMLFSLGTLNVVPGHQTVRGMAVDDSLLAADAILLGKQERYMAHISTTSETSADKPLFFRSPSEDSAHVSTTSATSADRRALRGAQSD